MNNRFTRVKNVIDILEERESGYATAVNKNFDALDMNAIETLAAQRQKKINLKEQLRRFLKEYENRKW